MNTIVEEHKTKNKIPFSVYLLAVCQALMMSVSTLLITASALVCLTLVENKALVTVPLSLQFLAMMLATAPASLIMGRYGRKFGFLLGSLFAIAGGLLLIYAVFNHSFYLFALGSFLVGIFNGFSSFYRFAAVELVDEINKAKAISYVLVGGVIAAFVGPNLANFGRGMFPAEEFVGAFVYATILYVCVFFVLSVIKFPPPTIKKTKGSGRPLSEIIKQPTFIVAVICGMLGYGVMTYVMTATPLAMNHHQHEFSDTAFVIQWHVLAMFAPSFFTGSIIKRVGVINVLIAGTVLALACMLINLNGYSITHFWFALVALGLSWNFLFIGASTLLTETYQKQETAKAQAFNDFMVFSMVTLASLSSGYFQNIYGWQSVNYGALLFVLIIASSLVWLLMTPKEKRVVKFT
ncbi:MAG: MFS family permease [Cocleimonas sp.]|jgi:MFS family permease